MIIGAIAAALAVSVVVAGIGGVIYLVAGRHPANAPGGEKFFLRSYLYLATAIGLIIMLIGIAGLAKVTLGEVADRDFSYNVYPIPEPRPVPAEPTAPAEKPGAPPVESRDAQLLRRDKQINREKKDDLINGLTLAMVGAIVLGAHDLLRRRMESGLDSTQNTLKRAFVFIMLVTLSIGSLVSLSTGISELLRFYLVEPAAEFETKNPPGDKLGFAIAFVPVWIYFIFLAVRQYGRKGTPGGTPV